MQKSRCKGESRRLMCLGSPFFLLLLITGLSFLSMPLRWIQHQLQLPELKHQASRFYQAPVLTARLGQSELKELSGLAASPIQSHVLWGIVDSGGPAVVYGFDHSASLLASVHVRGAENHDWEDLTSFQRHGVAYLIIADTGDNLLQRSSLRLYLIREPSLKASSIELERTIDLVFADGAHDIEAITVDAEGHYLYLLSKRSHPIAMYRVNLDTAKQLVHIERPWLLLPSLKMRPTAMAMSADGRRLAVLAYTDLYLWSRKPNEVWKQVLQTRPEELFLPKMHQAESIVFSHAPNGLFVASERSFLQGLFKQGSPLYFYAEQGHCGSSPQGSPVIHQ